MRMSIFEGIMCTPITTHLLWPQVSFSTSCHAYNCNALIINNLEFYAVVIKY